MSAFLYEQESVIKSIFYALQLFTPMQEWRLKMKLLIIGSQTRAERAQETLNKAGISSKRQKITETAEGCLHAVAVSDRDAARARSLLEGAGIRIRSVIERAK